MTPIINPWVFYLCQVAESTRTVAVLVGVTFTAAAILMAIFSACEADYDGTETKGFNRFCRNAKRFTICALISFTISGVIPSEDTITKILIAQNVTYERVEAATDAVETVYNDIMELFEEEE